MAKQDLTNNVKIVPAFDIRAISSDTTTTGDVIDTLGFESVTFVAQAGTLTDGAYAILIEDADESAFNVTNAAVADEYLIGTEANMAFALAEDNDVAKIGYIGRKRYVRMSIVSTSTSSGGTLGGVCVLGHPATAPQSTQTIAD